MPDLRPVLYTLGILTVILGFAMLVPAGVDALAGHPDWEVFMGSAVITAFLGGLFAFSFQGTARTVDRRQGFLIVTGAWAILPLFAALPLLRSELGVDLTDAYFETMSGLTTTGATVLSGLDSAPPGILLWRGMLQWLGGLGIIVLAVALLPLLQIGGMQLFRAESFDPSGTDIPRAAPLALNLLAIYVGLTLACFLALMVAGMAWLDAVVHAMTTIATGGYSTKDASVGFWNSAAIDWIIIFFMVISSLPFVLFVYVLERRPGRLARDDQVRGFLWILGAIVSVMVLWLVFSLQFPWQTALRQAAFNVTSVLTGTGYATADFSAWGAFPLVAFLFIMLIGGCAGSTSCGVKIFRWQVLARNIVAWARQSVHPHGVFVARFNGRPLPETVTSSVMAFFYLFIASLSLLSLALAATGMDYLAAVSSAVSALANVGPGLGPAVGPAANFAGIPEAAKWLMSLGMLLGRLELFAVLVLLTPAFWRG